MEMTEALTTELTGAEIVSRCLGDEEGARPWTSIEDVFEDGERISRTIVRDDGDVIVV